MKVAYGVAWIGVLVVAALLGGVGARAETAASSPPATAPAATFKVAVQVNDEQGKPIEGSAVSLGVMKGKMATFRANNIRTTDKEGLVEYELSTANEGYSIVANAEGYGSANEKVKPLVGDEAKEQKVTLVLKKASAEVSGVVVDADGKAQVGTTVMLHSANTFNLRQKTDDEGRFAFHVPEGEKVSLSVVAEKVKIVHAEAGEKDVKLVLPQGK